MLYLSWCTAWGNNLFGAFWHIYVKIPQFKKGKGGTYHSLLPVHLAGFGWCFQVNSLILNYYHELETSLDSRGSSVNRRPCSLPLSPAALFWWRYALVSFPTRAHLNLGCTIARSFYDSLHMYTWLFVFLFCVYVWTWHTQSTSFPPRRKKVCSAGFSSAKYFHFPL